MLPLWGSQDCGMGARQHPGDRAFHRAGGRPDALAPAGQILSMLVGLRLVLAGLALAEAVTFAVHFKDVHMVGQAVRKRAGQSF